MREAAVGNALPHEFTVSDNVTWQAFSFRLGTELFICFDFLVLRVQ